MTQVLGFRFAGVAAGLKKKSGALDLGLIVADEPANAAAVFTRNLVRAHPVHLAEERVLSGRAQALLVNSGNANACNGPAGREAALSTTACAAEYLGINPALVLPASTGVIGQVLPADKVNGQMSALVASLTAEGSDSFAEAICTTDRWKKIASTTIEAGGKSATVLAIGKGAGMFHPDLAPAGQLPQPGGAGFDDSGFSDADFAGLHATMLVYILTDAIVDVETLRNSLLEGCDKTFNAATVDGDTSTNDSVFLLASGKSGLKVDEEQLTRALVTVCGTLAKSMVLDGEGAEHAVTITVKGLQNDAEARDIARVIATSPLVKTALTGKDANWGRLLMAAGRSGIPFDPDVATIFIQGTCICDNGQPTSKEADAEASAKMKASEYEIEVILGSGPGVFSYITSDMGHSYIDVNAGYRS
jgi:glutamate N-acetyltransferase / amino-acid N-acetyltransferase